MSSPGSTPSSVRCHCSRGTAECNRNGRAIVSPKKTSFSSLYAYVSRKRMSVKAPSAAPLRTTSIALVSTARCGKTARADRKGPQVSELSLRRLGGSSCLWCTQR